MKQYVCRIIMFLFFSFEAAASGGPQSFNYEGRVYDASGAPSTQVVSLIVQIYNPTGTCLLRSEQTSPIDLSQTDSYFSVGVGSGTATSADPGLSFTQIFSNQSSITGGSGCSYTPVAGDGRVLRVSIVNSAGASTPMTPDIAIGSTPYAVVADSVQGLSPNNLLQVNSGGGVSLTQANLEAVFTGVAYTNLQAVMSGNYVQKGTNGTENLPSFAANPGSLSEGSMWYDITTHQIKFRDNSAVQTLGTGGGSVSSVTAGAGLTGGTITSSGTITLAATSVTAGTYTKLTVDSYGRATTGSSLSSVDVTGALGFTPVNKAGDTMTGPLTVNGSVNTTTQYLLGGLTALKIPAGDSTSIAVGNQALNSLSGSSVYNTAVGVNSLNQETTGTNNSALGSSALSTNTTGSNNTAVGYVAANYTATGSYNSAFGSLAMLGGGPLSGSNNSAMGYGAVESVISGASNNTGMGALALTGVTTGSGNVGLGFNAGGTVTTGSNNIAIGNNVQVASATSNYQINIGNLIYGAANTNVGIGTATPAAALDVNGGVRGRVMYPTCTSGCANLDLGPLANANTIFVNSGGNITMGTVNTINFTNMDGFEFSVIICNTSGSSISVTFGSGAGFSAGVTWSSIPVSNCTSQKFVVVHNGTYIAYPLGPTVSFVH